MWYNVGGDPMSSTLVQLTDAKALWLVIFGTYHSFGPIFSLLYWNVYFLGISITGFGILLTSGRIWTVLLMSENSMYGVHIPAYAPEICDESCVRWAHRSALISHITSASRKLFNLHSAGNRKIQSFKKMIGACKLFQTYSFYFCIVGFVIT